VDLTDETRFTDSGYDVERGVARALDPQASDEAQERDGNVGEEEHVVRRAEQWRNHLRAGGARDRAAWDWHFGGTDESHQNQILQRVRSHDR